ncbi:1298_t:CDS:2, partial [Racocetra persica]
RRPSALLANFQSISAFDEWTGLNGAWIRRFLREANLMSSENDCDIEKRVRLETANNRFQDYWETIILEKKQISVKRKHLAGSLDLLYASEEGNVRHILSEGISVVSVSYKPQSKRPTPEKTDEIQSDFTNNNSQTPIGRECELRLNVDEIGFDEYVDQGNKSFIFEKKNISSLFGLYRSKASALARTSGLKVTKNYHEILSLSHILLLRTDNYSEMQVKTFSRDTLENLRKYIKSNFVGKEKVSRDIKSILQEYIEIALDDDDGGLYKLRETI